MKTVKALLTVMLVLCCATVAIQPTLASDILPMNNDSSQAYAILSVDSSGRAHCTLNVRCRLPQYQIQAVMTLNQVSGSISTPVKSWILNGAHNIWETKTHYVVPGYTYQLSVSVTITDTDGKLIDSYSVHSSQVKYG